MPKFTDRVLAGLTLEDGRRDRLVFDTVTTGLGVRVTPKSKTFLAQWTDKASGRKQRESLGTWPAINVDQAREAARVHFGEVAKGINPKVERERKQEEAERQRAEKALTFDLMVDSWAALHLAKMRPRYRAEAVRAIKTCLPHLLKRPAARITKSEAVDALDRLVRAGKPGMAARTLGYARAAYMWGVKRGTVPANPFQGLPDPPQTEARDRVLNDHEIAAIWAAAETLGYPWGPFYRIAMLTLQRREEIAGMEWSEVDFDNRLWRIDGRRMKNGKPHDVHLSDAAVAILRSIPRVGGCDFVFSTTGKTHVSGYSKAKKTLDTAIIKINGDEMPEWVLHDFRRTGVSTLAKLGFDSIIVDKLLAHLPAKLSAVGRIYQRHEFGAERAQALDAWAARVLGQPTDANVVSLPKRA